MGFDFLSETVGARQVIEDNQNGVLIELGMGGAQSASDPLERLFELKRGWVGQRWGHRATTQQRRIFGRSAKPFQRPTAASDRSAAMISLPLSMIPEFIKVAPTIWKIVRYAHQLLWHLGDGNLHYNVFPPKGR